MIDTGLQNRVALVTGANHGIGAATAQALAAQGAAVFLSYLRLSPADSSQTENQAKELETTTGPSYHQQRAVTAENVVQTIRESGGQAEAWEVNLADPVILPQLFDQAEQAFGPVEVLVNNAADWAADTFLPAGWQGQDWFGQRLHPVSADSHDRHFAVNSRAVALLIAEFARRHVRRQAEWGRIISLSTDGAFGFAGEVSYGASKAALESYSRAAAQELGRFGITVNIVSPGPIQTGWITAELEESIAASIPLGRVGQPQDVADVIVFLASEQARWLTGQTLHVGGGHRLG